MDLKLGQAVVVVTGGSRGLGNAIAKAFAAEGARLSICGRTQATLDAATDAIRRSGSECLGIRADLFDGAECRRVVEETAAHFGRVDVLINNASTGLMSLPPSIVDLTERQLTERFMGKTMASIRCAQAVVPIMRAQGGGRIVCIGGTSARSTFRGAERAGTGSAVPQGLGNSALTNFVKHLSDEVAADGILVNVVHPHQIATERSDDRFAKRARELSVDEAELRRQAAAQFPVGRMLTPEDVVPLVLLLSSPVVRGITGQSIAVDGGALRNITY